MNRVVKCLFLLGTVKVFRAEIHSHVFLLFEVPHSTSLASLLPQCRPLRDPVSYGHSLDLPEESEMPQRPLFRWLNPCRMPAQMQVLPPGWNLCSGPMRKGSIFNAWRFRPNKTLEHIPQIQRKRFRENCGSSSYLLNFKSWHLTSVAEEFEQRTSNGLIPSWRSGFPLHNVFKNLKTKIFKIKIVENYITEVCESQFCPQKNNEKRQSD